MPVAYQNRHLFMLAVMSLAACAAPGETAPSAMSAADAGTVAALDETGMTDIASEGHDLVDEHELDVQEAEDEVSTVRREDVPSDGRY